MFLFVYKPHSKDEYRGLFLPHSVTLFMCENSIRSLTKRSSFGEVKNHSISLLELSIFSLLAHPHLKRQINEVGPPQLGLGNDLLRYINSMSLG